ncbi:peptide/nickel transport system permease protein [Palleronia aestuarii]|uniref:Peptide/nickel transport system permease protein n=1 Tax=Palleronia aestuarii TaxID=568105 RepID=A0A2W7NKC2_9RHOB|nr:ABC transporter permease [Palleronia aestuarii]PZX17144.1 peptide/nickel transport system permease protein [Palleronia aestuarii]
MADSAARQAPSRRSRNGTRLRAFAAELGEDVPGLIGFLVLVGIVAMAIFAPLLAPHDPAAQSVLARLAPPAWLPRGNPAHLLGTDALGRDVLSRIIWGARATLLVGVAVVLLSGTFGVIVGLVAGYVGGRTDSILMRLVDIQVSFPGILLILLIVSIVGPSLTTIVVVLALTNWMIYARIVRGTVMSVRAAPYVEAAEIVGCGPARIILRHILPNLVSPLLTVAILEFTNVVLAEAAISFLGLGVQPPATSWGLDVASGRDYVYVAWWLVTFPGLAIAITVLSINLFANWVRVTTDPREREKRFGWSKTARRLAGRS